MSAEKPAAHFLVVSEFVEDDPDDCWELEHPESCPREWYGEPPNTYYENSCHEGMLIDDGGFGCYFRHAEDEDPHDAYVPALVPGRYPVRAWTIRHPSGPWGAEEWSAGLEIVEDA